MKKGSNYYLDKNEQTPGYVSLSFESYLVNEFQKCFWTSAVSRVAQWRRAGPITQRSEDQNLALLNIVSHFLTYFVLFFN